MNLSVRENGLHREGICQNIAIIADHGFAIMGIVQSADLAAIVAGETGKINFMAMRIITMNGHRKTVVKGRGP